MTQLKPFFANMGDNWTMEAVLPGGDFTSRQALAEQLTAQWPWLNSAIIKRWVRSYGTRCQEIMADKTELAQMGIEFGHGLYQAEVDYMIAQEWALTVEDILWRRSKLGLCFSAAQQQLLQEYLDGNLAQKRA